jgi:hypothetical protein
MTNEEWFAEQNPVELLKAVSPEEPVSPLADLRWFARQERFFACAAVRPLWDLLSTDAHNAVLASERFAEGRASETDLVASALAWVGNPLTASQHAREAARESSGLSRWNTPARSGIVFNAFGATNSAARATAVRAAGPAPRITTAHWHAIWTRTYFETRALHADYLRDIFPPPNYQPQRDSSWITTTVFTLAQQMDETGDYSVVPILGDALQDAGCDDPVILACCRTPAHTHVRGNWVVDLVLERT